MNRRDLTKATPTRWDTPPQDLRAHEGIVDVWRADVEQSRSREVLMAVLCRYTGVEPNRLRLAEGPNGKPKLDAGNVDRQAKSADAGVVDSGVMDAGVADAGVVDAGDAQESTKGGEDLRFNLSHSDGLMLVAVTVAREVGIDVEVIGRDRPGRLDEVAIARRVLGAGEARRLAGMEGKKRRIEFLRAWTRHEARIKCLGIGLGKAMAAGGSAGTATSGSVDEEPIEPVAEDEGMWTEKPEIEHETEELWTEKSEIKHETEPEIEEPETESETEELWTEELDVGTGAVAAVAVQGGESREVRRWEWDG